jgi:glucose-6-phosphate isomerase
MHSAHDLLTRWPALDVAAKRARLQNSFRLSLADDRHDAHERDGRLRDVYAAAETDAERAAAGLWHRDPAIWSADPAVQQTIANRLGWLSSPALMADAIPRLETFASSIRRDGFADIVLLGMGGSSLAPEVLRAVLGVAPDWPRFHMLDSTDPAAVRAAATTPARTLYILASKSGTTIEPNSLAAHFRHQLEASVAHWNDHFIAITDEGTELARRARGEQFRDVFINPSDIGGRYSAMSFFGLVPAALMGQNLAGLVGWALAMLSACEPGFGKVTASPAAAPGLAIGGAALAGRDKLTLLLPNALEPFGLWVEQLVAESTGKNGKGVVPIAGEPLGQPGDYGSDRFFIRLRLHGSYAEEMRDTDIRDLKAAGAPLGEIDLPEPCALGAEFVRWEVATAIAGALLRINPFNEPNVQQAKDATRVLLDGYISTGKLLVPAPDRALGGTVQKVDNDHETENLDNTDSITLTLSSAARAKLDGRPPEAFLTLLHEGDYFGLLAYLGPDPELAARLHALRVAVRDRTRVATMFGYGPRYLHSTGQLHKGGPNTGVFLLITATPREDLTIPGKPFSFGTLEFAQALGDLASLDTTGRRALHVHLPAPDPRLVGRIADSLLDRLRYGSGRGGPA